MIPIFDPPFLALSFFDRRRVFSMESLLLDGLRSLNRGSEGCGVCEDCGGDEADLGDNEECEDCGGDEDDLEDSEGCEEGGVKEDLKDSGGEEEDWKDSEDSEPEAGGVGGNRFFGGSILLSPPVRWPCSEKAWACSCVAFSSCFAACASFCSESLTCERAISA